ncbi:MAG: 16S rRNA (guanine(966)-N(2))-methyltransferase RsmD [Balneolaceae bacterium]|nr:16S rRNA (guanine(966)-N(2))-methyltransferase RsmD [Balneolaceae bacterium]
MRIITGTLKGRQIRIPKTLDVRPTTDRVKEGMFSVIDARKFLAGARVTDLFAGSGGLGFEALSRGAEHVLFVEQDARNTSHIEELAEEFGVADRCRTAITRVEDFLEGPTLPADFVLCDPPYEYPHMEEMVDRILEVGWLHPGGWLVLEHDSRHDFREHPRLLQQKEYGRTYVCFFEAAEA